jgi:hypothetical protein
MEKGHVWWMKRMGINNGWHKVDIKQGLPRFSAERKKEMKWGEGRCI